MFVYLFASLLVSAPSLAQEKKSPLPPFQGACFIHRGENGGVANLELAQGEERSLLKENGYEFKVAYDDHGLWLSDEGTPTLTLTILKEGQPVANSSAPLSNRLFRPLYLGLPAAQLRFYCRSNVATKWVCESDGSTNGALQPLSK